MILDYLKTGGFLMIPIAAVTFLMWHCYFSELVSLKCPNSHSKENTDLHFMAALVAAAPLLGLLGTVIGMIDTFHATATIASAGPDAASLADGIGKALVTTQAGLVSAIPGALALAHLRHIQKKRHA
ncbi:MAG: MotA/TolQ/ExbB proton channel family protein [Victivallales bacterium]|nr:MotA/TolQ/ExbB proton channel family protein [Victivallales bacterium]